MWTQESFPTTLRASAQGAILAAARIAAALLALVTPALLAWNGRLSYLLLAALAATGLLVGWLRVHRVTSTSLDEEDAAERDAREAATAG